MSTCVKTNITAEMSSLLLTMFIVTIIWTMYSKLGQVKFVEDNNLEKPDVNLDFIVQTASHQYDSSCISDFKILS